MGQSVDLRVLTAEEFGPFRQRNIARYAQELLFARATDTEEHALTEAQGALDEMLPQGADTPRNYLLAAQSGGETVGELWCDTTEPETVFINDFFVYPACRGHGWGNAMLTRRRRVIASSNACRAMRSQQVRVIRRIEIATSGVTRISLPPDSMFRSA